MLPTILFILIIGILFALLRPFVDPTIYQVALVLFVLTILLLLIRQFGLMPTRLFSLHTPSLLSNTNFLDMLPYP